MGYLLSLPPRDQIAGAIEVMVAVLDAIDGDSDLELNGDEMDGSSAEEDIPVEGGGWLHGPGCPVGDPGEPEDGV